MSVVATRVINKETSPRLIWRDRAGWYGKETWWVNTADCTEALFAPGLPAIGKPWGGRAPISLTVISYDPPVPATYKELGGNTDLGEGGLHRITVNYATPQGTAVLKLPNTMGDRWTDIKVGRGQANVINSLERYLDVIGNVPTISLGAIRNGDGATIDLGTIEARIATFHDKATPIDLARLTGLMRPSKLNDGPITLPAVYGTTGRMSLDRGQARYMGWEPTITADYLQITHVLDLAEEWFEHWAVTDAKQNPTGDIVLDRVYEYASFQGLW